MFNEKEYDLEKEELELMQKGADALKASIDYTERLEVRICGLETKFKKLEKRFNIHLNNFGVHNE